MHIHRLEKIWLGFGCVMLAVFLLIIGVSAFASGNQPPSDATLIDPTQVDQTKPFDKPGLKKIDDNKYEAVMVSQAFQFTPQDMVIKKGATVDFLVTSKDVVHGFEIVKTNVNMMVVPGHINSLEYTFEKAGDYLIVCNEYCGTAHHMMSTKIKVVD
ncbi:MULTISPECIES: cytochrome c oxidase subunit II [Exiguobacterium]|uniref:Cytochrome aa3 subunit 2 n=1 Tax=Exiguobacterium antarcticum TaxID=132920 RepID=A0ABT6R2W0_9BACL|nr:MULTISPECIES: cytochrome c oxidase subunit II [Exiguobacterium]AFS69722.1 Cytochrome c oxidase subunit II [Exiguobacterium antarcticum B7]MCT4779396.1 cytochrome c oxidase subunit II [Exiguobacterium soli]MDI3235282.1 cytochrome c oxidase subunit II [Exiguobacterium antarcticum]